MMTARGWLAMTLVLGAACGSGTTDVPSDGTPVVPPVLVPSRVTLVAGDSQTAVAGTVLPVPLVIEVRDQNGDLLPGAHLEIAEISAVDGHLGGSANLDATDASGLSHYPWVPSANAGVHHLRIVAYKPNGSDVAAGDTVTATVLPGPPARLIFATSIPPQPEAFLGQSIDLAPLVVSVHDLYDNVVPITTTAVTAAAPLQVSGTTVISNVEVDAVPELVFNGVPFNMPVHFYRDLRELAGAHGGWVCSSQYGASAGMNTTLTILRRDATLVLDSVVRSPPTGGLYSFYFDLTWADQNSDGSTGSGHSGYVRKVVIQNPGGWLWEYGPGMQQTSASPLAYVQANAAECASWETGGTIYEEPLWITK